MKKENLNKHLLEVFRAVDRLNWATESVKLSRLNKEQKIILRAALTVLANLADEANVTL